MSLDSHPPVLPLSPVYPCVPTLYDQDFGLEIDIDDLVNATIGHLRSGYLGPLRHGLHVDTSGLKPDKDNFKVLLDVQHFSPDEVQVKANDGQLIIEGKHGEKKDEHGYISRHFVRRYRLPEGVKAGHVITTLSSDGVLTITAPKVPPCEDGNVRNVPITHTGTTAIRKSAGH